jgi:molecular chaperone GrpE
LALALESAFEKIGITKIETIGKPLDPLLHNAIQVVKPSDDIAPNTITEELQAGYMMGDNVLRTAMVVVAK